MGDRARRACILPQLTLGHYERRAYNAPMGPEELAGAPRRPLPPVSEYLRSVFTLGRRSFGIALPALILLYCYHLLMNLFLALSSSASHSIAYGHGYDQDALLASIRIRAAFYLPLMVLIYTPFLPLQDAILKNAPRSFAACAKIVLERFFPFLLSAFAQIVFVVGPPALLFGGMMILIRMFPAPARPESILQALAMATLVPCVLYAVIITMFIMFATPALVLEHRGPLASIRVSFGLVSRNFGGILGRLLAFFFLLVVVGLFLSIPEGIVAGIGMATGSDNPGFAIAQGIWSAAISTLIFPFSVAALMVLYRSVSPAARSAETAGTVDPAFAGRPTTSSPFVFE